MLWISGDEKMKLIDRLVEEAIEQLPPIWPFCQPTNKPRHPYAMYGIVEYPTMIKDDKWIWMVWPNDRPRDAGKEK